MKYSWQQLKKIWIKVDKYKMMEQKEEYLNRVLGEDNYFFDDNGGLYVKFGRRYWYMKFPIIWQSDKSIDDMITQISKQEYICASRKHR